MSGRADATAEDAGAPPADVEHEPIGSVPLDEAAHRAALAAGAPRVPRHVIAWAFIIAAALTLVGAIAERVVSQLGLDNASITATTSPPTSTTIGGGPTAGSALLPFTSLPPEPVPAVALRDQTGALVPLRSLRGRVVVLTFFNATCTDICGVLARELADAEHDLGGRRTGVVFVTVNTDPKRLWLRPLPAAVTTSGLDRLANWYYLTGPLRTLDPLWRELGIAITVYVKTGVVVHNDVVYLVDRAGRLVERGDPFSDESRTGVVRLPAPLERIAGHELARAIVALLGPGAHP